MRRPKRIAVLLITGFFAFAPPGTLIVGFIVILGLVRNVWLAAGGILALVAIGVTWIMLRRRADNVTNQEKVSSKAEP